MTKGAIFATVVVAGYIVFELNAMNKARYRMEADYIYDQYVSAHRALTVCGKPENEQLEKFLRNLEVVQARAMRKLSETHPGASADELSQLAATQAGKKERAVNELIETKGCADTKVRTLFKRFEIYAGLNLG